MRGAGGLTDAAAVLGAWEYVVPASFTSPPPRHGKALQLATC